MLCMLLKSCMTVQGKVKQIVGSSLDSSSSDQYGTLQLTAALVYDTYAAFKALLKACICRGSGLVTNYESDNPAEYYASLYKQDDLPGGHIIMLDQSSESRCAHTHAHSWHSIAKSF